VRLICVNCYTDDVIHQLHHELEELLRAGHQKIVIDFSLVIFMSYKAIGALHGLKQLLDGVLSGCSTHLAFCNVAPNVMETFVVLKLDKIVFCASSREEAIDWLSRPTYLAIDTEERDGVCIVRLKTGKRIQNASMASVLGSDLLQCGRQRRYTKLLIDWTGINCVSSDLLRRLQELKDYCPTIVFCCVSEPISIALPADLAHQEPTLEAGLERLGAS
jgi:anti-anti-sigma regulatory factor